MAGLRTNKAPVHKQPNRKVHTKKAVKKSAPRRSAVNTTARRGYEANLMSPDYATSIHSPAAAPAKHGISGHKLRVMKLYRGMLRNTFDWTATDNDKWVAKAQELHQKVAATKDITDPNIIETLIKDAEIYLHQTMNPNPYRALMHPQGGLWGRNHPMPRELLRPAAPNFEEGRNYNVEEMVIRHMHAEEGDEDFAPTKEHYAQLKVARGEHVEPDFTPINCVFNPVVVEYCKQNNIKYTPDNEEELVQAYKKIGIHASDV